MFEKVDKRVTDPNKISFKDILAVIFTVVFLFMIVMNFFGKGNIEVSKLLNNSIEIVLTGYFLHEIGGLVTDAYVRRKYGVQYTQGGYSNYRIESTNYVPPAYVPYGSEGTGEVVEGEKGDLNDRI